MKIVALASGTPAASSTRPLRSGRDSAPRANGKTASKATKNISVLFNVFISMPLPLRCDFLQGCLYPLGGKVAIGQPVLRIDQKRGRQRTDAKRLAHHGTVRRIQPAVSSLVAARFNDL